MEAPRENGLYFIKPANCISPDPGLYAGIALYFREGAVEIVHKIAEFTGDCPRAVKVSDLAERIRPWIGASSPASCDPPVTHN